MSAAAELTYLKQIAENVKALSKGKSIDSAMSDLASKIDQTTKQQNTIINNGNTAIIADLNKVNDTLTESLITEVEEEGETDPVKKSIFEVMKDAIVAVLHDALMVEVTEGQTTVEKSIFEVMKDAMVAELHGSLYVTVSSTEKGVAELLNEIKGQLGNIGTYINTGDANIVDALSGTNGVTSRLATIATNTGNAASAQSTANELLDDIKTNTADIQVTASLDDSGIINALVGNSSKSVVGAIEYADNYGVLEDIKENTDSIDSHVSSIDSKTPNPNP